MFSDEMVRCSSLFFYCSTFRQCFLCPLPLPYLSVEFKKHKAGARIQFQESFDPKVSSNVPSLYSGQKWDDNREVSRLGLGVQVNQVQYFAQLNTYGLGFRRG